MSVPYTLHLHPVIAPSLATDLYEAVDPEMERPDSADESITDGMEHIFNTTTQLRFGRDLRLNEVKHLLCSTRPVSVPPVSNGGSEQQQVNFPTNMASIADTISWPEFHNGVAAGLRIAPFQARMSRTWIMYNKPDEPNFSHAGLLLALGLHGHLRVLASTDVYDYLSQYHEATITGLLLGLGASHRGTMNPRISKVSLAIGFLFLGGGMRTFATNNGAIAALLITLWYDVPPAPVVDSAMQKVMECFPRSFVSTRHNHNPRIPLLALMLLGTGHLQTFRLLRYPRLRNHAHIKYGNHMAVSLAIGFMFLGGCMGTFATKNSAIIALLISLYPTFRTKPDDNDTHLQLMWTLGKLYTPLEITIRETRHHAETTYCRVTPCILPERSVLKRVQVCGPRYWPQDIELSPADHPWWGPRDKHDPFNGGILYVKRKVGACSYADDPTGCQSLLSRVMHKVSDGSKGLSSGTKSHGPGLSKVDQLVGTFSADPSLLAFAQLCCDNAWKNGTDNDFQEFCLQVLFDCVSTDRPALLQTYLYLYTTVGSLADCATLQGMICNDTLFLSSVKVAVAYYGALVDGKLQSARGELIQSTFLASIAKRVEDILCHWQHLPMKQHSPYSDLVDYLTNGKWPLEPPTEPVQRNLLPIIFLAYYLRWYDVPPAPVVNSAMQKVMECFPRSFVSAGHNPNPRIPLLGLMLPGTHVHALSQIDECYPCAS